MNYSQYYPVDVLNGPGTRCVLFVSGCTHHCKGCYNKSTWKFTAGLEFDQTMLDQIVFDLTDTRIPHRGLTISGGDPLHPRNLSTVHLIVTTVRDKCPGKDIWIWTGYTIDQLSEEQMKVVNLIDVLVDGKFEQDKHDPSLVWVGSSNQKIYYIKK